MSTKRPNTTSTASKDLKVGDRIWMIRSAHYRDETNRPTWNDADRSGSIAARQAWAEGEGAPMTGARTIAGIEVVWHGENLRRGERRSRYYLVTWAEGGRTALSAPSRHPVITDPAPEPEAPARRDVLAELGEMARAEVLAALKATEAETPSAIGRRARVRAGVTRMILDDLVEEGLALVEGNGARRLYRRPPMAAAAARAATAPASEEAPTLKLVLVDHCPQGSLF